MFVPCTHSALHIRNVHDAMVVFEAVRQGILPLLDRRLSASERDALRSGNLFVWEEGEHKQGLERWTDGRRWSQSRLRNEFLYYDEKLPITQGEREMKAARRAEYNNGCSTTKPVFRRSDRPTKPNGLTKQTYSTLIRKESGTGFKKWHIVAYFSMAYNQLPVIEDIDYLRALVVPKGIFMPSRGPNNPKPENSSSGSTSDDDTTQPSTPQLLDSPSPYPHHSAYNIQIQKDAMPSLFPSLMNSPASIDLFHPSTHQISKPLTSPLLLTPLSPPVKRKPSLSLDSSSPPSRAFPFRFSTTSPSTPTTPGSSARYKSYQPLTPEDARVLNSFPLRL